MENYQTDVDRELIRDNIFSKYKFDIHKYPIVVFYKNVKSIESLKPFKRNDEAIYFCSKLQDIYSLLISIMNHYIECRLFLN